MTVLPGWLGLDTQGFEVGIWEVARTVLIFLGIPLTAGLPDAPDRASPRSGRDWYEQRFIPRIAPITLYGLLFTIVLLFAIQGDEITVRSRSTSRGSRCRCSSTSPCMWVAGLRDRAAAADSRTRRLRALAFTVASNDFELAIAVAVGVFGATSGQALAGVVGPLIEVPVLVALVYVALWLRGRLAWPEPLGRPRVTEQPPAATIAGTGGIAVLSPAGGVLCLRGGRDGDRARRDSCHMAKGRTDRAGA